MKRWRGLLKLPWLAMFILLILHAKVSAQLPLPDIVCVGVTKSYWVDPRPGSTYTWIIDGVVQSSTTHEIVITWDGALGVAGSPHTLSVQEQTAAGCFGLVKSGFVYVNPPLSAGISISATSNPVCSGANAVFTAQAINGGSSPVYQWYVNNTMAGTNSNTFSYLPQNGDEVKCELTSNAVCITNPTTISEPVVVTLAPAPGVSFIACFDNPTTPEALPFKLKGGFPLGGTYSGAGVNSATGVLSPGMLAPGTYPITYSYTNSYNCSADAQQSIEVLPAPAFNCGEAWTDVRDGKSYPTVLIDGKCWFAANLDHGIRILSTLPQSDNCEREKYCYNDSPANCTQFGGLYQWDELMSYDAAPAGQGICPPGWHIPTEPEWQTLMDSFGGPAFAGLPLRDPAASGFHALMGGVLYQNNTFSHRDLAALFWTSTPVTPVKVISHGINNKDQSVSYYESLRNNAFPVRCVKN